MLFAEGGGVHQAHDEDSREEKNECQVLRVTLEVSHVDEDESDDEVQESP